MPWDLLGKDGAIVALKAVFNDTLANGREDLRLRIKMKEGEVKSGRERDKRER